jgi:SAM-dependent methyltransferase
MYQLRKYTLKDRESLALANKIRLSFWDVLGRRTHLTLGRTLPRLLRAAGLTDLNAEAAFSLGGPDARRLQRGLTMCLGPHLIADGQVTENEIYQHLADLDSRPRRRDLPGRLGLGPQTTRQHEDSGMSWTNSVLRAAAGIFFRSGLAYRLGSRVQQSDVPDHRLVELVEGPDKLAPGRALDLGSGTGRNTLYLARHGWETIGVEMVRYAVELSQRKAATQPVKVRFVQGDVTKLADLDIGTDFTLLMDGGCYHMIPADRRDAYVESITRVAAPGARFIMVGFSRTLGVGRHPEDLLARLPGWRLVQLDRLPGEQMYQYVAGPALLRAALKRGALHPLRYELERAPSTPEPSTTR